MGADTKALRSRIKSVNSTLHLTKAMGLVASSKIRRATDAMLKGREYSAAFANVVNLLLTSSECTKSSYLKERQTDRMMLVVIAGDRGLAGGYNANIFRLMSTMPQAQIYPIGKRAVDRYGNGAISSEHFSYEDAKALAKELCEKFTNEEFDRLGIVSTHYVSMMTQEPEISWLLPLVKVNGTPSHSVLFEPDEIQILNCAMPEYVAAQIYAAVCESFACEVAARRMAMDSAGKNAKQMIDDLTLEYNRARQGSITQEITEIVAGSGTQ